jgi:predicted ATPase
MRSVRDGAVDLVGRERELELLAAFLTSSRESGSAMLIRGEPGIGKTSLWRAGTEQAREAGITVLACRCFESEMPLPFAALLDLLKPVIDEIGLLPAPQRAALEAALERAPSERLAFRSSVKGD